VKNKTVYLTFDDGIQEGTLEVIDILNTFKIKATFFLSGLNTSYSCQRSQEYTSQALQKIIANHLLGNHSFSHCHDFYHAYYTKGLLINNQGDRISASQDFYRNDFYFKELLLQFHLEKTDLHADKIARLPGRNSWYLNQNRFISPILSITNNFYKADLDSGDVTQQLFKSGYEIFGWNQEWQMSFDFSFETRKNREKLMADNQIDYGNPIHVFPNYDMNTQANLHKDRITESWQTVAKRILSSNQEHIILLMHDRAFRRYTDFDTNRHAIQLEFLIDYLKTKKINFNTLDNYRPYLF